jgi:hypothetical protein
VDDGGNCPRRYLTPARRFGAAQPSRPRRRRSSASARASRSTRWTPNASHSRGRSSTAGRRRPASRSASVVTAHPSGHAHARPGRSRRPRHRCSACPEHRPNPPRSRGNNRADLESYGRLSAAADSRLRRTRGRHPRPGLRRGERELPVRRPGPTHRGRPPLARRRGRSTRPARPRQLRPRTAPAPPPPTPRDRRASHRHRRPRPHPLTPQRPEGSPRHVTRTQPLRGRYGSPRGTPAAHPGSRSAVTSHAQIPELMPGPGAVTSRTSPGSAPTAPRR